MSDDLPPESLPPIAAKADDLEAVRAAMVDAAAVSSTLWISYLFALFYLLVAAGAVTHRDLFFENPVKLPFLGVDLPLKAFFWLGPALFVIVHGYVLLHFVLLAGKIGVFDAQLRAQVADLQLRARLRRQLPSNIFVQFLAGPVEIREGLVGLLLEVIAWISLVIGPVLLLVFFQLQFLPYHEEWITWWQRIAVLIDVSMLWALWPAVVRETDPDKSAATWSAWRRRRSASFGRGMEWLFGPLYSANRGSPAVGRFDLRWSTVLTLGCVTVVSLPLVFAIATFPGEWLQNDTTPLGVTSLRHFLVAGGLDATGHRTSWWSNTLVLPYLDVTSRQASANRDSAASISTAGFLRGRDLRGADLAHADLRQLDLSGVNLSEAVVANADLRAVKLDCTTPIDLPELVEPERKCATLSGAFLMEVHLEGASLVMADLRSTNLLGAHLEGASLDSADMQRTRLDGAHLEGASLTGTNLQAASLYDANLQAATLRGAQLQKADLDDAQLQGASLDSADLSEASLVDVHIWRTSVTSSTFRQARVDVALDLKGKPCVRPEDQVCGWSVSNLSDLRERIASLISGAEARGRALGRVNARLDPRSAVAGELGWAERWARLSNP